jgi:hypothetical protein
MHGIHGGIPAAAFFCMAGVKRYEDLNAHKLAVQLRRDVFRLTSHGVVGSDYRFVSQIRNSARGGARNIAEGFSRCAPPGACHQPDGSVNREEEGKEEGGRKKEEGRRRKEEGLLPSSFILHPSLMVPARSSL